MTEQASEEKKAPAAAAETTVEDALEEGTDLGSIRIHNNVITIIARLAALKVPGVVEMSGTLVDGLAGMIGKKGADRGIRIEIEQGHVVLDLFVVLEYGVRIPQAAWQIQNDVREAVQQMTGKTVYAVNVIVQGVRMASEEGDTEERTQA
jgi:uncharacterized alkaline shock family protein YloU